MELELAHSESKSTFGDASGHDGAAPASKRPREEAAPPRSLALEDPAALCGILPLISVVLSRA